MARSLAVNIPGPSYWASYLINGDASGITDAERELADARCERNRVAGVVDCGEPFFSWFYGFHTGANVRGGDLVEYTVQLRSHPSRKESPEALAKAAARARELWGD